MASPLARFLERCSPLPDGFAGLGAEREWRLGAVLFTKTANYFAAIQKAPQPDYEFSDRWAMPGGMVRIPEGGAVGEALPAALLDRVGAEAGFAPTAVSPQVDVGPIMTSYTTKGAKRFVLVTVFVSEIPDRIALKPSDASVQAAEWLGFATDLGRFAPANRLALAHALWPFLNAASRKRAQPQVEEALDQCNGWAAEAGINPAVAPWAGALARAEWAVAWPS